MSANAYPLRFHKQRKKKNTHKTAMDGLVYFAVVFGPLMTVPQVYSVWVSGEGGVSATTWASYAVVAIIWLAYGLKHKDKPIIALQALWFVMDVAVVTGTLMK